MTRTYTHKIFALFLLVCASYGLLFSSRSSAAKNNRGLHLGSGKLHPYYQLEPHFVTNPNRYPDKTDLDLAITNRLGAKYKVPGHFLAFVLGVDGQYDWYAGMQNEDTKNLRDWNGGFSLGLDINRKGAFSVDVQENLSRSAQANIQSSGTLRVINNSSAVLFKIKPGGGALQFRVGYNFNLMLFSNYTDIPAGSTYDPSSMNYMSHAVKATALWRFLPKTALTLTVRDAPIMYLNAGNAYTNVNSYPLEATVGLVGLITARLNLILSAGYTNTFSANGNNRQTAIGNLQLMYQLSAMSQLKIGYDRGVFPVAFFQNYSRDKAYLHFDQMLNDSWSFGIGGGYSYLVFGADLVNGTSRLDGIIEADANIKYKFNRYFALQIYEQFEYRHSDYTTQAGTSTGYLHNNFYIKLDVRY